MICPPAPTAYRSSVPVADRETIRRGRWGTVTAPAAPRIVRGKEAALALLAALCAVVPEQAPSATAASPSASHEQILNLAIKKPPRQRRGSGRAAVPHGTALPPRACSF